MGPDERAIREVHSTWIDAVNAGDLVRLLTLMADDVVFLNPGRAPFGRDGFSADFSAAHQQVSDPLHQRVGRGRGRRRSRLHAEPGLVIGDPARRRRSDAARRSSYHGIPQTARRPLAPGPRCPHVVPGGEAEVVRIVLLDLTIPSVRRKGR